MYPLLFGAGGSLAVRTKNDPRKRAGQKLKISFHGIGPTKVKVLFLKKCEKYGHKKRPSKQCLEGPISTKVDLDIILLMG